MIYLLYRNIYWNSTYQDVQNHQNWNQLFWIIICLDFIYLFIFFRLFHKGIKHCFTPFSWPINIVLKSMVCKPMNYYYLVRLHAYLEPLLTLSDFYSECLQFFYIKISLMFQCKLVNNKVIYQTHVIMNFSKQNITKANLHQYKAILSGQL